MILFVVFFSVVSNFIDKLTGSDSDSSKDNSTHENITDVLSTMDKNTDPSEEAATSQKVTDSKKAAVTEAVTTAIPTTETYDVPDDEYIYPADLIGLTVEDMINIIGEPDDIKKGGLDGSGKDTDYFYNGGADILVALYAPESSYNFDDRDAFINVVYVYDGYVNKYIYTGMTYSELCNFYDMSDYYENVLDGTYQASAEITCNGVKCTLVAENSNGNTDSPITNFSIVSNELYN